MWEALIWARQMKSFGRFDVSTFAETGHFTDQYTMKTGEELYEIYQGHLFDTYHLATDDWVDLPLAEQGAWNAVAQETNI